MKSIYHYTALTQEQNLIQQNMIANSKSHAVAQILEKELIPIRLHWKMLFFPIQTENQTYNRHFFYQLHLLLHAGLPVLQCIQLLQEDCHLLCWQCILNEIEENLTQGTSLSIVLKKYPDLFPNLLYQLIHIGETTGQLEQSCQLCFQFLDEQYRLRTQMRNALRYPLTVLFFLFCIIIISLLVIFPEFQTIYQTFHSELPSITQFYLIISMKAQQYSLPILFIFSPLVISYFILRKKLSLLLLLEKRCLYHLPISKQIIRLTELYRIFLTLSVTTKSGLTLLESLQCTLNICTQPHYHCALKIIYRDITQGVPLHKSVRTQKIFPKLCQQFIYAGENTGDIHHFINQLAHLYKIELSHYLENSIKKSVPILMGVIALNVLMLLLAMYLPIFNLGNIMSL